MKCSLKHYAIIFILLVYSQVNFAQVGIGNTNPDATLDITASNVATPSNTDGILIPRVDNFPLVVDNPGANQDGMLVFATGNGTPTKGFYFWNNTIANWDKIRTGENNNIPFVTRAELDAIIAPENGQLVYNSTNNVTLMWNGSNWIVLSDDCFPLPTIANAGANQVYNDTTTSTTLAANTPVEGTGLWTILTSTGGSFADATNPTTTFTGNPCTSYLLRWTITTACGSPNDSATITFSQMPTTSNAGPDIFSPSTTTVTLSANTPTIGTGMWTITSDTGGSFADATDPTTTFTGTNNTTHTLRWTITSCSSQFDEVAVYIGIVIGQFAYGGIIFYIDGTGTSGLVVSNTSQSSSEWLCSSSNISTGTAIGTGNSNTTAIFEVFCFDYAALTCRNLNLNGFSDWFLPSLNELQQLRIQRNVVNTGIIAIGGGSTINTSYHWSSSQATSASARAVLMSTGFPASLAKTSTRSVRAIRAF